MSGSVNPAAPAAPVAPPVTPAEPAAAAPVEPVAPKVEAPKAPEPVKAEAAKPVEAAKPPAAIVVPETYKFTVPEGVTLDAALVEKAAPIFKKMGLSQEAAQELVSLQLAHVESLVADGQKARTEQAAAWAKEMKADKEYGGDKLDANVKLAQRVINTFDKDGSLTKLLEQDGYGNHPGLIKFCLRVAAHFAEDSFHGTGGGAPQTDEQAQLKSMFKHPSSQAMFKE